MKSAASGRWPTLPPSFGPPDRDQGERDKWEHQGSGLRRTGPAKPLVAFPADLKYKRPAFDLVLEALLIASSYYIAETLQAIRWQFAVDEVLISSMKFPPERLEEIARECTTLSLPLRRMRFQIEALDDGTGSAARSLLNRLGQPDPYFA